VDALTPKPQPMDKLLESRKKLLRRTARYTLAASLTCGAIVGTGINSPAQTSQPEYKQQPPTQTGLVQIERRRIGPVILAAIGPAGLNPVAE
jgi:hypothetical protein